MPDVDDLYQNVVGPGRRLLGHDYYGDFLNWGYWKADTETQIQACENLVDLVMSLVPSREDNLLEAGCGIGGVIRRLADRRHYHYPPAALTGINIMPDQLEACRRLVPDANFVEMNAARMTFPEDSFATVISVEAAFHFNTREQFLREALRVLRPGGYLAIADIIGFPLEGSRNFVANPAEYQRILREAGFCEVRVIDVTADTIWGHADRVLAFLRRLVADHQATEEEIELAALGRVARVAAGRYYVVAGGRKPIPGKPAWRADGGVAEYLSTLLVRTASV